MVSESGPVVGIIIAAAGRSERVGPGDPKQFRPIGGIPMLLRSIRPFAQHRLVRDIVVALPSVFVDKPPQWLAPVSNGRLRLVAGGDTRALSVRAALRALDPSCTVVLVHDAARPFVSQDTIDAVIGVASRGVGAVPGVAVQDTLKRADGARVTETVDRRGVWQAHTPQGFPREILEDAFAKAGDSALGGGATDESALVEAAGYVVELVPDRPTNIKITTPEDFHLAEALASR